MDNFYLRSRPYREHIDHPKENVSSFSDIFCILLCVIRHNILKHTSPRHYSHRKKLSKTREKASEWITFSGAIKKVIQNQHFRSKMDNFYFEDHADLPI